MSPIYRLLMHKSHGSKSPSAPTNPPMIQNSCRDAHLWSWLSWLLAVSDYLLLVCWQVPTRRLLDSRPTHCSMIFQRRAGSEPDPLPPRLTIEHQNWFSTALYRFMFTSFATTGQQTRRTYINEIWLKMLIGFRQFSPIGLLAYRCWLSALMLLSISERRRN